MSMSMGSMSIPALNFGGNGAMQVGKKRGNHDSFTSTHLGASVESAC